MSIMTQLEFELEFTDSEKEIAKYILNHGDEVLSMSIKDLSRSTYTSPATIVRLCRKIGLDGYNDFKIRYSAELQYTLQNRGRVDVNYPFTKDDTYPMIAHKLSALTQEVIEDTIKLVDFKTLEKAAQLVISHQDVDIYGNSNSLVTGLSFQHKLTRIGINANMHILDGEQIFFAYGSHPTHLSIMISYSGETDEVIRCAKILKEKHVDIIAITSVGDNQLSRLATVVFNVGSREKIFNKIAPFASMISTEYILNLLYACVFQKNYDHNILMKVSYDKRSDARHPFKSPINEE